VLISTGMSTFLIRKGVLAECWPLCTLFFIQASSHKTVSWGHTHPRPKLPVCRANCFNGSNYGEMTGQTVAKQV